MASDVALWVLGCVFGMALIAGALVFVARRVGATLRDMVMDWVDRL
jgi:hypothetical protein